MNRIFIQQSNPEYGRDNKTFRAYLPAAPGGIRKPLGVTASSTAEPASVGARCCAVKAFIKFAEPNADRDEIETRIALKEDQHGQWIATLEPKEMNSKAPKARNPEVTHFNGLTPAEAERLALLAEECGEVIQVIGKILRHGYQSTHPDDNTTNRELLQKELGDVRVVEQMLVKNNDVSSADIHGWEIIKSEKIQKYLHHQTQS